MAPFQGRSPARRPPRSRRTPSIALALGARGMGYERLDQLTFDLLMGVR